MTKKTSKKEILSELATSELQRMAKDFKIKSESIKKREELVKALAQKLKEVTSDELKVKIEKYKSEVTKIQGIIANFRLGPFTQHNKEFLIRVFEVEDEKEASKYIGRRVIWQSEGGKKLIGKILRAHGKNGILLTKFRKGLPGQAIGSRVEII